MPVRPPGAVANRGRPARSRWSVTSVEPAVAAQQRGHRRRRACRRARCRARRPGAAARRPGAITGGSRPARPRRRTPPRPGRARPPPAATGGPPARTAGCTAARRPGRPGRAAAPVGDVAGHDLDRRPAAAAAALRRSQASAAGDRSTAYTMAAGTSWATDRAIAPEPLHRSTTSGAAAPGTLDAPTRPAARSPAAGRTRPARPPAPDAGTAAVPSRCCNGSRAARRATSASRRRSCAGGSRRPAPAGRAGTLQDVRGQQLGVGAGRLDARRGERRGRLGHRQRGASRSVPSDGCCGTCGHAIIMRRRGSRHERVRPGAHRREVASGLARPGRGPG